MAVSTADVTPSGVAREYDAFRTARGGFVLRSPSGLYRHDGPDALDLLHRITTNDLASLTPGNARRTVVADDRGRVVDAPWVVMRDSDDLLLITDLHDTRAFERAILKYTIIEDACLTDVDGQLKRISLIGEGSERVVRSIVGAGDYGDDSATSNWMLSGETRLLRTSFGAMPAWELVTPVSQLDEWREMLGTDLPMLSVGTFHAIRIQEGIPWPSYELTSAVNPLESGLADLIDFDKGCYIGQEVIARLDTYDKVQRSLIRLRLADPTSSDPTPAIPVGSAIWDASGSRKVGWISSSAVLPTTDEWVGLGFARKAHTGTGTILTLSDDGPELIVVG